MIPMQNNFNIPYEDLSASNAEFRQEIDQAIKNVLDSGWYILGQEVSNFEKEFSEYLGAKHCIGVANGLDALILSIEALGLPFRSDILVASNTYIATILAIVRAGHNPILVEPNIDTFNINPDLLDAALTDKTRAVCVTHLFGKSCEMDRILTFCNRNKLKLIEDCAQSHGAKFDQKMTGTFGEAGCFSFYPTKNLGAFGDAGAIVTNNDEIADRIKYIRNYGSKIKYYNEYVGYNSRLDEIQAAILRVKLKHIDKLIQHKKDLANIYYQNLPTQSQYMRLSVRENDVFHIFAIKTKHRDDLKKYLIDHGIKTEIHYPVPPHKQKAMKGILFGHFPIADYCHMHELSLPISYGHNVNDIINICNVIKSFFNQMSKH